MRKPDEPQIQRRELLTGRLTRTGTKDPRFLHVTSAIITTRPEHAATVARDLAMMPGTEVHAVEGAKIILVMEGSSTGEIGARMAEISLMDRVIAANMVFEQILPVQESGART